MQAARQPVARSFHAIDLDLGIVQERMEQAHRVRAAADAGDERIGQTSCRRQHLLARFVSDHRLKVAHHHRIGVRPGDRADAVKGVRDIRDPVAQRLVHGILERLRSRLDRTHLGSKGVHAQHIGFLPLDVDHAHIDDALEPEFGAHRRGRNPVHAGPGFGNHARLSHAAGEQDLAEHVVHLVRAGVIEVLALEIDLGAAQMLAQALGEVERRRPSDIVLEVAVHLFPKARIVLCRRVGPFQFQNERHQRFGDEAAAIEAEMPAIVGAGTERIGLLKGHAPLIILPRAASAPAASRAAATNARILSGSFSPGARSTPDETSTPGAAVRRSASATLPAWRPPESMNGTFTARASSSRQSKLLPRPPGGVASAVARASKIKRSATLSYSRIGDRSARSAIGSAFITGSPKRLRTAATRSGASLPWSCSRSGLRASMLAASSSSLASTESATFCALPRTRSPSAWAISKLTCRGEAGKKTKPTRSAPAASATSSASGVFRPQILIRTDIAAGSCTPRFYLAADGLSRPCRRLIFKGNSRNQAAGGGMVSRGP